MIGKCVIIMCLLTREEEEWGGEGEGEKEG